MTQSRWRKVANEVIVQVALENPNATPQELRKIISAAYPFGERAYHPYKIWLSAVKEFFREIEPQKQQVAKLQKQQATEFQERQATESPVDELPLFSREVTK